MTHIKPCILTVDLYNTYRERMPEYVQYDRQIPLEITVMAHGKPADLTGMFARISIGKPDGHHVYHDNVEITNNIISTTFGDQEFTTAGLVNVTVDLLNEDGGKIALIPFIIRVKSAVIADETIKSSNDYQTITALIEDVRSLDEMFHVEQDNRAEDFAIQMSKWDNIINEQEKQREIAEAKRASAEDVRNDEEMGRKQNELLRKTAEQQRANAESDRKRGEVTRSQDETARCEAETIRESNESSRKIYENDRQSEEEKRIMGEAERIKNESKRAINESARITAEVDRTEQESIRATAESARVATESKRATAEEVRVGQEEARRLAEEDRATRMTIWEAKAEEMAQETQEMVSSAQNFINVNESRLLEDNARTDYMGNAHKSVKDVMDANVEFVLDEVNTVHYEGQTITATDTIERQVRSAILKGQTEINRNDTPNTVYEGLNIQGIKYIDIKANIQPNSTYTVFMRVTKNTSQKIGVWGFYVDGATPTGNKESISFVQIDGSTQQFGYTGWLKAKIKTKNYDDNMYRNHITIGVHSDLGECNYSFTDVMILDGDKTNITSPPIYFEGMQSVRMPVLTTTGKNTLNPNEITFDSSSAINPESYTYSEGVYTFKNSRSNNQMRFTITKQNASDKILYEVLEVKDLNGNVTPHQIAMEGSNDKKYWFSIVRPDWGNVGEVKIKLGVDSLEPYKSNILSIDGEYRGIGDVCDTVDVGTGEYVQRCGEIITNNLEPGDFYMYNDETLETTIKFGMQARMTNKLLAKTNAKCVCNTIPTMPGNADVFHMRFDGGSPYGGLTIWIEKDKLESNDITGLVKWLRDNNTVIQYEFATPTIKTVDLSNQKVYSYDGTTHYTCSSEDGSLIPTLSIDVPTNLPALVSRQRNTIQELEKENEVLKEEVVAVDHQREDGDLELLSSDFDLDFRLMEIEFALDISMIATFKGVKSMARTPYEMAKTLILGGKYERSGMEYKLGKYLERKQITQDQYDELISLMDANELI